MDDKRKKEICDLFSYEIVERITRFILHLEEVENQFYMNDNSSGEKLDFIGRYKDSLFKILEVIIVGQKALSKYLTLLDEFKTIQKTSLNAINTLHKEYLSILPRPIEPVELARFRRVIDKQIVQIQKKDKQEISISINEEIGEEISIDPLSKHNEFINALVLDTNRLANLNIEALTIIDDSKRHITIPRIDATNTFRWSSLIHEMCHSLMSSMEFEKGSIEKDYLSFIQNEKSIQNFFKNGLPSASFSPDKNTLSSWLTECWCDIFACILIGPSFYFSQFLAFINENNYNFVTHPPAIFRLHLIESIISSSRFPEDLNGFLQKDYLSKCSDIILTYQNENQLAFNKGSQLARIWNSYIKFFKLLFFKNSNSGMNKKNEILNKKLSKHINKYANFSPDIISQLVTRLNTGLPIPSIRILNKNKYEETPTYIQEIFLASWISRSDVLCREVTKSMATDYTDLKVFYLDKIAKPIVRHDQAVLKSIQISEWFDFYNGGKSRPKRLLLFKDLINKPKNMRFGTLVDTEIEQLIFSDQVKILPIMDLERQLGSSSLDIRLGTNFQLFFPDQYGIVDFTEEQDTNMPSINYSKKINLDFPSWITIAPGQFLLGHSMEYIKLPDNICASLEGRSSFARLGIEIHMTAGFIDPGFEGVLTLEIYNAGPSTVKLYPGFRIGQLRFERTITPKKPYGKTGIVKYKGLLEHKMSRQSFDDEVMKISHLKNKKSNKF